MSNMSRHSQKECPYLHVKDCEGCGRSCGCYTMNAPNDLKRKTSRLRVRKPPPQSFNIIASTPKIIYSGIFCGSHHVIKSNKPNLVIAVDFDGTLAELFEPYDPKKAGPPLNPGNKQSIFNKVKRWVQQGKKVVVLTARMNSQLHTPAQLKYTRKLIGAWTKKHFGKALPCTAEKHYSMSVMYDDRAVAVDPKTGRVK
jgi:hypothetical protein